MLFGIRIKLLASYLLVIALCVWVVGFIATETIGGFFVDDMEKSMIDKARLLIPSFPPPPDSGDYTPRQLRPTHAYIHKLAQQIGHRIRLVDTRGMVLVDSARPRPLSGESLSWRPEVRTAISGKYKGNVRHDPEAPKNALSMFIALPADREDQVIGVIYLSSTMRHVAEMMQEMNALLRKASVIAGLAGLFLSILLARLLTRPIHDLRRTARHLASGDLSARAHVRSGDELGQLAKALNEMADRLADLERLRRDYLSDISHELRTPLTAIKGYTETLLEAGADDPAVRQRFLNGIAVKTDQLSQLVQDLLDLARLEAGTTKIELKPTALAPIITDAIETFRLQAEERRIRLIPEMVADLPDVMANQQRLSQILANLVANALHAIDCGEIRIHAAQEGDVIRINVSDTGSGIPEDEINRIFDRFYRVGSAAKRGPGAGLGLAIVKQLIEAHNGRITVTSRVGEGTTFSFTIPIAPQAG